MVSPLCAMVEVELNRWTPSRGSKRFNFSFSSGRGGGSNLRSPASAADVGGSEAATASGEGPSSESKDGGGDSTPPPRSDGAGSPRARRHSGSPRKTLSLWLQRIVAEETARPTIPQAAAALPPSSSATGGDDPPLSSATGSRVQWDERAPPGGDGVAAAAWPRRASADGAPVARALSDGALGERGGSTLERRPSFLRRAPSASVGLKFDPSAPDAAVAIEGRAHCIDRSCTPREKDALADGAPPHEDGEEDALGFPPPQERRRARVKAVAESALVEAVTMLVTMAALCARFRGGDRRGGYAPLLRALAPRAPATSPLPLLSPRARTSEPLPPHLQAMHSNRISYRIRHNKGTCSTRRSSASQSRPTARSTWRCSRCSSSSRSRQGDQAAARHLRMDILTTQAPRSRQGDLALARHLRMGVLDY